MRNTNKGAPYPRARFAQTFKNLCPSDYSFMPISSSREEFDCSLVKMLPPYTYTKAIHLKPPRHKTSEATTARKVQRLAGSAGHVNLSVAEARDHFPVCKLSVE